MTPDLDWTWATNEADAMLAAEGLSPTMEQDLRDSIAAALKLAENRGHRRAVEEAAIASIHKAVAAERAAVVAWLRKDAQRLIEEALPHAPCYPAIALRQSADAIERGDHHTPEQTIAAWREFHRENGGAEWDGVQDIEATLRPEDE